MLLPFSYGLGWNARTLFRGAYGIYYDRPFDNLWQILRNNNVLIATVTPSPGFNYLAPVEERLRSFAVVGPDEDRSQTTLFQQDPRTPYVHNFFLGLEHQFTDSLTFDLNGLGSLGRKLITTDVVNRRFSAGFGDRYNGQLPDLRYRANQGFSNHYAMAAVLRYRASGALFQVSYTWGHTIDNQSEALAGDYLDLSFTQASPAPQRQAAFTRQFDSAADRGDSDFDQRQSLLVFSTWEMPGLFSGGWPAVLARGWRLSLLGACRSGLPFTVFAPTSFDPILNNRANLRDPGATEANRPERGGAALAQPRRVRAAWQQHTRQRRPQRLSRTGIL